MKNNFFFVAGASGSGSTVLAQVLTNLRGSLGVGDAHRTLTLPIAEKFTEASQLAWERLTDFKSHDFHMSRLKKMLSIIETMQHQEQVDRIVFRRSTQNGDTVRPDLVDIMGVFPYAKVLVAYRDPASAAYSAYSRRLGHTLRHCALQQEEQLTLLSAWVGLFPSDRVMVVEYEDFCARSRRYDGALSEFCGVDVDDMYSVISAYPFDRAEAFAWTKSAKEEDVSRLMEFFSPRKSQWMGLIDRSAKLRVSV